MTHRAIVKSMGNQLKTCIDKISMRRLGLQFKSDNTTKSKAIKYMVKKLSRGYEQFYV